MAQTSTDRIEKRIELKVPVARVWRALTEFNEFSEWFGVALESPFVCGEVVTGSITCPGYEHMKMEVAVERMEHERLFSYRWYPCETEPGVGHDDEPSTLVEFKLEPMGDGTLLLVTESGFDAISAKRRDDVFRRNDGGWTGQMKNIETHVTKGP